MRRRIGLLLVALIGVLSMVGPAHAQADQRCFQQTSFCISGQIRTYWEQNGGLPVFGYPISAQQEEAVEGIKLQVQWFERNRIELHPANARPYDVLLGRVGAESLAQQARDWFTFPKSSPQPGCRFFAETGHNVCGDMLAYWRAHRLVQVGQGEAGSLALWGLPLSDLMTETLSDGRQYQVQWFERARLELHPENRPPFHVLGGLLGRDLYAPVRACTQVPTSLRTTSSGGVQLIASEFQYRGAIENSSAGIGYMYLTLLAQVVNNNYQGPDGQPAPISATPESLRVVDARGRSYAYDPSTLLLADDFAGGQILPSNALVGRLSFRIPNNAQPAVLVYDGRAISSAYPRIELLLSWPACAP